MEKNQNAIKSKKKIPIALIICFAVILVCAGVTAGTLIARNMKSTQNGVISSQMEVEDEETLRKVLLADTTCSVTITKDIVVSKELTVNGSKTLHGKSIIMDLKHTGTNESVCAVIDGANLVLDGATIDGNGVVNGVSVKAGGKFTSLSGNIEYGYPYGIEVSGIIDIKDIMIHEAMHTGISVSYCGEAHMTGGTISDNIYAVAVAEAAYIEIGENAVLTNSAGSFIINYGKVDITGGKYEGTNDNAITNEGELSIKGSTDKKIEICNIEKSAIVSRKNSKVEAENLYMHDLGMHGLCVMKGSKGSLKDSTVENAGKSSIYINSSTLALNDISILDGKSYAISATQNAKVEMEDITIKNMATRGISNDSANVKIKNAEIQETGRHGIYVTGEKAVTSIDDVKITKTGAAGIGVAGGTASVKNATITSTKKEGVSVGAEGKAHLDNVAITEAGTFGAGNYGGVLNITADKKYNPGNKNGNGLTIARPGKAGIRNEGGEVTANLVKITDTPEQAIYTSKDGVTSINNCKINGTGKAAVYVTKSKMNMRNTSIEGAKTYGIYVTKSTQADKKVTNLNNITITKPGDCGIGNDGSYVVMTNVTVTDAAKSGIRSIGAVSVTNMNKIKITNPGEMGFRLSAGTVTARNVDIANTKKEGIAVGKEANVRVDNVTITEAGTMGIANYGGTLNITVDTKYNPDNKTGNGITITRPGGHGIHNEGGKLTARSVAITDAPKQAVYLVKGTVAEVNYCKINKSGAAAVYVQTSNLNMRNAEIKGAKTDGIYVEKVTDADGKKVNLNNVTITKPGKFGVENNGSHIVMTNITITDAASSGVFSNGTAPETNMNEITVKKPGAVGLRISTGKVTARNVTITDTKAEGISMGATANVRLDDVVITKPGSFGIGNYGGTLNITVDKKYNPENTTDNGVTITNPGTRGIYSEGGQITANYVTITDTKQQAIYVAKNGSGTIDHCKINGATQAAVYISASKLTVKNTEIEGAKTYGIYVTASAKADEKGATLEDITITKPGNRGIGNDGSWIVMKGVQVTDPVGAGIYAQGENSITNMHQITITNPGASGLGLTAGTTTARNVTIENSKTEGVYVGEKANVQLDNATIAEAGSFGIGNYGGTLKITVDKKYNPDNAKDNGATITNPKRSGILSKGGTVTCQNVTIQGAKEEHGIHLTDGATVTGNSVTIQNAPQYGVMVTEGTTANLSNTNISGSGSDGIYTNGTLNITADTTTSNGVTVTGAGEHGIRMVAGMATADHVTLQDSKKMGLNVQGASNATISNLVVKNVGTQGVYVANTSKVGITDFVVNGTGSAAVRPMNNAELTLTNGTVSTTKNAIYLDANTKVTATNVKVERVEANKNTLVVVAGKATLTMNNNEHGESGIDGKEFEGRGVEVQGTFILNGGNIINNKVTSNMGSTLVTANQTDGAGIYVVAGGTFTMNGGNISKNTTTSGGAGVILNGAGATFTFNEGTIQDNTARFAAVMVRNGSFQMNKGSIKNNTATENGGAIYLKPGYTFTMNGGEITGNKAVKGGAVYVEGKAAVNLNAGTISGNTATQADGQGGNGIRGTNGTGSLVLKPEFVLTDDYLNMKVAQ